MTSTSKFWDLRFSQLAKFISLWSKDPSTKVGAVIVRPDKTIASVGFNGFPRGVPDLPMMYSDRELKYKLVKHAEENAILFSQESLAGYTLYVYPLPPCSLCAGDIIQRGIKRVVAVVPAEQKHRISDKGFAFHLTQMMFEKAGVQLEIIDDDEELLSICDNKDNAA